MVKRTSEAQAAPTLPGWVDSVILFVAVAVSAFTVLVTLASGAFNVSLINNSQWSWFLVRAAGMVAYSLLAGSTLWGLFLSTRVIKDWSPGPLTLLLHAATSWLAVVFAVAHMVLLLFDNFYTYTLPDLLVPFVGPYRPLAVGLGVMGFWLMLVVVVSFMLRRILGKRTWVLLHYTSYVSFGLITVHALTAGTDSALAGMKIVLGAFSVVVALLLIWRVSQAVEKRALAR